VLTSYNQTVRACILCRSSAHHTVISVVTSVLSVSLCLQAAKCDRTCRFLPASVRLPQLLCPSQDQLGNYPRVCALISVYLYPMFSFGSPISFCHLLVSHKIVFFPFFDFSADHSTMGSDFPLTPKLGQSQANSLSPDKYDLQVAPFQSSDW